MTDDQQRVQVLLDERAKLIRERDELLAEDPGDLLDVARRVRDEASRQENPNHLCVAICALDDVLVRFDEEPWKPPRRPVQ
jgi:hypothetical protein